MISKILWWIERGAYKIYMFLCWRRVKASVELKTKATPEMMGIPPANDYTKNQYEYLDFRLSDEELVTLLNQCVPGNKYSPLPVDTEIDDYSQWDFVVMNRDSVPKPLVPGMYSFPNGLQIWITCPEDKIVT